MTMRRIAYGCLLASLAGSAIAAPPVVDGKLDTGAGYQLKWVNTVPTQFGDNIGGGGCNESDFGNPGAVTTGIEVAIPLTAIGSPSGAVRVAAFLNSQGHNNASNQFLGGIGTGAAPLGNPRVLNLGTVGGNQYFTVSPAAGSAIAVDGTLDAAYGSSIALQNNRTSAGDNNQGLPDAANGSELDGGYGVIRGGVLYIFLTGNLKSDFGSKIELFIDNGSNTGFNKLPVTLPNVDFGALQAMNDDGSGNGLTFDAAFKANYYMTFGAGGGPVTYYPNFADLVANVGNYLGSNQAGNGSGVLSGGNNPDGIQVSLNNLNTIGVPARCPPAAGDANTSSGSELDNLYSYVDTANNKLYLFLGGNLQNNFNKIDLWFDVESGGQNTMGKNPADNTDVVNVDIDFGGLVAQNGLTFEPDFGADYWLGFTNGNDPVEVYSDAAVIRSDGPRQDGSGFRYDYGAYDGGPKSDPAYNPLGYNGPRADAFGSAGNIFTNYAPRTIGNYVFANPFEDPLNGAVPGLIKAAINNSNIGGVIEYPGNGDAGDFCDAQNVTTGLEFCIDLAELGWDGISMIRVSGAVQNGGHNYMSNQVLGGLPNGSANLADTPLVNFANIGGVQYVCLTCPCPADINGDGFVDGIDYDTFNNLFEAGSYLADYNHDCFVDGIDYDQFNNDFETACP
jgi:hypothetical protein